MKNLLLFFFLTNVLWGCINPANHNADNDNFYTDKGSWDAVRIPLIKPYELLRLNGNSEWTMNLDAPSSVTNIKEINIVGDVIVIHSGQTYCNNVEVSEAWFVVVPNKHIEKGFDNKLAFNKYLLSLGHKAGFQNVEKVFQIFNRRGKIDWDTDY
jgi:hypothetical protein